MKTCLLVDDDAVYRDIGRAILEEMGFVCEEAHNGQEAYNKCKQKMPDLILLDWNMPVMNGYEFLLTLRKDPLGFLPKVIFSTSETRKEFIDRGMEAGADAYLGKPIDFDVLMDKVNQLVSKP